MKQEITYADYDKVEIKVLFLFLSAAVNSSFIFSRNDMNFKNINLL